MITISWDNGASMVQIPQWFTLAAIAALVIGFCFWQFTRVMRKP